MFFDSKSQFKDFLDWLSGGNKQKKAQT